MAQLLKLQRGQALAAALVIAAACFGATAFSCTASRTRSGNAIHTLTKEHTQFEASTPGPNLRGSGVQTAEGWLNWSPIGAAAVISAAFAFRRSASNSQARNERLSHVISCNVQGGVEGVRILGGWANATNDAFTHQNLTDIRITKCSAGIAKIAGIVPATVQGLGEEHELARGTTENCYVLYDEKDGFESGMGPLILIDTPEMRFKEAFLKVMDPYMARIEGIVLTVLNEAEDNMMFKAFVDSRATVTSNKLKVYCVSIAQDALIEDFEGDACLDHIEWAVVEDGTHAPRPAVDGAEKDADLIFLHTSTPKIPEGLTVFDHSCGFLFTGKFFSAHTAVGSDDPTWASFCEDWHHFFDCYFFTETAQRSVRRIFQIPAEFAEDELGLLADDVTALAPLHGPTVKSETWRLMVKYEAWLERKLHLTNREGSALLMYTSAYGNTKKMAEAIKRGILSTGVEVNELDLEFCNNDDISKALALCDGIALGSPTLGGQMPIQAKEAIGVILEQAQKGGAATSIRGGKPQHGGLVPCGVFGSYGWSGEAVDEMYLRLKDGGFQFAFDPIRCKFTPTQAVEDELQEAGVRLAQKIADDVKRKAQQAADAATKTFGAKEAKSSSMEDAFGRIVNSSSILTMKGEDSIVRLPVSWVSQASFVPPGVMLALHQEGLDSFLALSIDEQLTILFEKYDADGSGVLDKEETMALLDDLFGAGDTTFQSNMLNEQKEKSWELLDADGSGEIEAEELREAAQEGELANMISEQRRFASLESVLSASDSNFEFTLSMLPESMTVQEGLKADLLEGKLASKNGCNAISGCTAFIECQVMQHGRTGNYALLYGKVTGGEVLNAAETTQLLCATHQKIESVQTPPEKSMKQEPELSLAAVGSTQLAEMTRTRSAFTGISRSAHAGSHQKLAPRRAMALAEPQVMSQENLERPDSGKGVQAATSMPRDRP